MCQGLGPKKHDEISEIDRNVAHIQQVKVFCATSTSIQNTHIHEHFAAHPHTKYTSTYPHPHTKYSYPRVFCATSTLNTLTSGSCVIRKSHFVHHHHHHHPGGVVYRSFCLNSNTFAVSEIASRRWWCIESLFPSAGFLDSVLP